MVPHTCAPYGGRVRFLIGGNMKELEPKYNHLNVEKNKFDK
jgi:hypothetical protein